MHLRIGIDLDNTIINYENSFKKYLKYQKLPIKKISKKKIKELLIKKNFRWNNAQEEIYGFFIKFARPYKYFKDFEKFAINKKIKLFIVSHKTIYSEFSKKYNLRVESNKWLRKNINIENYKIIYTTSISKKIEKINSLKLDYFIDDLIVILKKKKLSKKLKKIYFSNSKYDNVICLNNWKKITQYFKKNEFIK